MIVVALAGGMGNQMFQYACGRALAEKHRTELLLDCSFLQDKTPRPNFTFRVYELDIFAINAKQTSNGELKKYRPSFYYRVYSKLSRLIGLPIIVNPNYLSEQKAFHYSKAIEKVSQNCFLAGYWQNEKYFKPIEPLIRQDFTFKRPLDQKNADLANRIRMANSVSLHIRRGDYVNNSLVHNVYSLCSLEYYQNAICYIEQKINNPGFFIFSDDIEWAKTNLKLSSRTCEFVSGNTGKQSHVDMQLMSICRHNIIANSSFSWWGAWLNANAEKIVLVPEKWFNDPSLDVHDLIPESWIKIKV